MNTLDRPAKKLALLGRALRLRIRQPAPRAVVAWAKDHLLLPASDIRRMKKLYDKLMEETTELDSLLEACAAMNLLRARIMPGPAAKAKSPRA